MKSKNAIAESGDKKELEEQYGEIVFPCRLYDGVRSIYVPKNMWKSMTEKGFRGRFAVANRLFGMKGKTAFENQFKLIDSIKTNLPVRVKIRKDGCGKGLAENSEVSLIDVDTVSSGGVEYRVITIEYPRR